MGKNLLDPVDVEKHELTSACICPAMCCAARIDANSIRIALQPETRGDGNESDPRLQNAGARGMPGGP
jgi:hypothetical protein